MELPVCDDAVQQRAPDRSITDICPTPPERYAAASCEQTGLVTMEVLALAWIEDRDCQG